MLRLRISQKRCRKISTATTEVKFFNEAYMEELGLLPVDDQIRKVRRDLRSGEYEAFAVDPALNDWLRENKDRILEMDREGNWDE